MKSKLPGRASTYLFLAFLSPLGLVSTAGPAERDAVEVPPNAHLERSGRGWPERVNDFETVSVRI